MRPGAACPVYRFGATSRVRPPLALNAPVTPAPTLDDCEVCGVARLFSIRHVTMESISNSLEYILNMSTRMPESLQIAIISSGATIIAASIGVLLVFEQIRRQATNILLQARENERIKLKIKIYEEAMIIISTAISSASSLSNEVRGFIFQLNNYNIYIDVGVSPQIPTLRANKLNDMEYNLLTTGSDVMSLIEKWIILDKRLSLFLDVIHVDTLDLSKAFTDYFIHTIKHLPTEVPNSTQNELFPWSPPIEDDFSKICRLSSLLEREIGKYQCHITDLQHELQNILLGDMFDHHERKRTPTDDYFSVIDLNKYEEISKAYKERMMRR